MNKIVFVVALCVGLLAMALPATAQDDIFPGDATGVEPENIKAAYNHEGRPVDFTHGPDQMPANNTNPMPWYWHPQEDLANVAGLRFQIHYDSYEAKIVDVTPGGLFMGHYRLDFVDPPPPESQGGESYRVVGTVWIDHQQAQESGTVITASQPQHIFDVHYEPQHTSQVSNPLFNSEFNDIVVNQLTPIFHVTDAHTGSQWEFIPGGAAGEDQLVHVTSVPGVWVPNGQEFYGPIHSDSAPDPQIMDNWIHVQSAMAHADVESVRLMTPAGFHEYHWAYVEPETPIDSEIFVPISQPVHVSSITLTGGIVHNSSFLVGAPVNARVYGLGIDHVPEPVSLALLGMGGLALVAQMWIRRRRRTA